MIRYMIANTFRIDASLELVSNKGRIKYLNLIICTEANDDMAIIYRIYNSSRRSNYITR